MKEIIKKILNKNKKKDFSVSEMIEIKLPESKSNIIQKNNGIVYCGVYSGLAGLFRKDTEETKIFGRELCDKVKKRFHNKGFFTSDELPAYGISTEETKLIINKTNAEEKDLIMILSYNQEESEKIKEFIEKEFKKKSE